MRCCHQCVECGERVEELEIALCESLVLQSHYATLLNRFDDGNRLTFATAKDWIERLHLIGRLKE
jgi:hypothetical protein